MSMPLAQLMKKALLEQLYQPLTIQTLAELVAEASCLELDKSYDSLDARVSRFN